MRAVCPGSFDPVTRGHLDVIGRAAALFGEVVVAVGRNASKSGFFTVEERVSLVAEACADHGGVRVEVFDGLLVDFCSANGIGVIVKGVRSVADVDYEMQMAQMNARLSGVQTVFLPTAAEFGYVSSSLVREVARLGGDVSPFLTAPVLGRVRERVREAVREQ